MSIIYVIDMWPSTRPCSDSWCRYLLRGNLGVVSFLSYRDVLCTRAASLCVSSDPLQLIAERILRRIRGAPRCWTDACFACFVFSCSSSFMATTPPEHQLQFESFVASLESVDYSDVCPRHAHLYFGAARYNIRLPLSPSCPACVIELTLDGRHRVVIPRSVSPYVPARESWLRLGRFVLQPLVLHVVS